MKVSILTPDVSINCFGRAWLLAKVLERRYEVEIVGPVFGNGIWEPLSNLCDFEIKTVKGYSNSGHFEFRKMLRIITGDVIYASKPYMVSFGVGLVKKIMTKKPLVLDIDDWELGLVKNDYESLSKVNKIKNFFSICWSPFSYWNLYLVEKFIRFADNITVSNPFLKQKFGGIMVPHGRDTNQLNPEKYNVEELKDKLRLRNKKVISYIGTPRFHKGMDELIEVVKRIKREDVILLLVGLDEGDYSRKIISLAKEKLGETKVKLFGREPVEKLGEFLAVTDLVIIPQRDTWATQGQTPAKIFDAMAMGKPIISTIVSDTPQILEGCGFVVKPDDIDSMAEKANLLLEDSKLASTLGRKAREKCMEKYSWDAMEKSLFPLFDQYNEA